MISCVQCGDEYIGETARPLCIPIKEHLDGKRKSCDSTALSAHRHHYLFCVIYKRGMLTTCVTVSIIFAMLMYEISYSLRETMKDEIESMTTDDVTSTIRDWGPVSYAGSELETM
ncbi:hypothetical protein RB195_004804 [Necator americanus]|uniref:Uncharacterized protein n=1 Tax=Necator americanus TaxID=51031 RepID=A0ABR1BNA5_NECAM